MAPASPPFPSLSGQMMRATSCKRCVLECEVIKACVYWGSRGVAGFISIGSYHGGREKGKEEGLGVLGDLILGQAMLFYLAVFVEN